MSAPVYISIHGPSPKIETPEQLDHYICNAKGTIAGCCEKTFYLNSPTYENFALEELLTPLLSKIVSKRWSFSKPTLEKWLKSTQRLLAIIKEAEKNLNSFQKWYYNSFLDHTNFQVNTIQQRFQEVFTIHQFIEKNQHLFFEASRRKESIYLDPRKTNLERAIHFSPKRKVFIHLNRKKKGDSLIGKGAYKTATFAWELGANKRYVSTSQREWDDTEWNFLREFKHEQGFVKAIDSFSYEKPEGIKRRILFEYCNAGNLNRAIEQNILTPSEKKSLFCQIIQAVAKIHEKGFLHRDLKPNNIFLDRGEEGLLYAHIGDFGSMCKEDDEEARELPLTTPTYASPEYAEALVRQPQHSLLEVTTTALDSWSLACILFELLDMGTLKWEKKERAKIKKRKVIHFKKPPQPNSPEALVQEMFYERLSARGAKGKLSSLVWPA